eukprot:scaffold650721_cov34-Prasinocladus_malaysianus.AAC.1
MHVRAEHGGPHEVFEAELVEVGGRHEAVVVVHLRALALLQLLRQTLQEGTPLGRGTQRRHK